MFLGVVYRPPASSVVKFFEDFLSYVGFLSSLSSSFVICGDFNFHVDTMLCLQQSLNLNQSWILAVCPNTLIFQLTFMVIP